MTKKQTTYSKGLASTALLLVIAVLTKIISLNARFVEKYYSTGIYIKLSVFLRTLTKRIPFSLGEVLLLMMFVYFFIASIYAIRFAITTKVTKRQMLLTLIKVLRIAVAVYVAFNLFWGLNYHRLGISFQVGIVPTNYSTQDLKQLSADLVKRVNAARSASNSYLFNSVSSETIFQNIIEAYKDASYYRPFLRYHQPCIKRTLFSDVSNYLGIAGYYNPLTGEVHVNTSLPTFVLPQLIAHEIAHQLGYANESDANFAAYLVLKDSRQNELRYAAYFALFNYANEQLATTDRTSATENFKALNSLVKADVTVYRNFVDGEARLGAKYSSELYRTYLSITAQPSGLHTYEDVVALVIAFQRHYGEL